MLYLSYPTSLSDASNAFSIFGRFQEDSFDYFQSDPSSRFERGSDHRSFFNRRHSAADDFAAAGQQS